MATISGIKNDNFLADKTAENSDSDVDLSELENKITKLNEKMNLISQANYYAKINDKRHLKLASNIKSSIYNSNYFVDPLSAYQKKKKNSITYINSQINHFDSFMDSMSTTKKKQTIDELAEEVCKGPEILKKSIATPDFMRQESVPCLQSRRQLKKKRRLEREKTKGDMWFGLPTMELTDEIKNDLTLLQMRHSLDPKRFYKHNDLKAFPKYFQVGTVVEPPADFYHARIPKKQRKQTLVDELLGDQNWIATSKKKCEELERRDWRSRKWRKEMKKKTSKKKFEEPERTDFQNRKGRRKGKRTFEESEGSEWQSRKERKKMKKQISQKI